MAAPRGEIAATQVGPFHWEWKTRLWIPHLALPVSVWGKTFRGLSASHLQAMLMRRSRKFISKGKKTQDYIWMHDAKKKKTTGLSKRRCWCLGLDIRGAAISVSYVSLDELSAFLPLTLSASVPALHFFSPRLTPQAAVPSQSYGVQGEGMWVCLVAQKLQDEGMRHDTIVMPSSSPTTVIMVESTLTFSQCFSENVAICCGTASVSAGKPDLIFN